MKKFRGKTRNNNKYLSFKSEFLIEIIVARNNCRLHLKWMLSCFKIIHFWLSSSPCLTEAKQFWNILIKTEAHSACFISSLWIDYVISFCRKPLENTQGFKMNTSFAIVFPINFLFPWLSCFLKSLLFNETAIAITRLNNFHMVLYILRACSVYFIFHQVSLSKYLKKTIGIQLSLTNVKIPRRKLKKTMAFFHYSRFRCPTASAHNVTSSHP